MSASALARRLWLAYALTATTGALVLLAAYVNVYDDDDVSARLRALGRFSRRAMWLLSFPAGPAAAALAQAPLERAFGCGDADAPCAFFVAWNVFFAGLAAQIVLLRRAIAKRWRTGR